MNKVKKVVIFCLIILIVALIYLVFLYGFNKPLEDVTGCYFQDDIEPHDRICLYDGGRYEQFSQSKSGEFEKYNTGDWRSYSSQLNDEKMTGVTLTDYFDRFENQSELDIFPYRNMFDKSLFVAGPPDQQRFYVRE